MKIVQVALAWMCAATVVTPLVAAGVAVKASETDPRKVAEAVEAREVGDRQFSKSVMTIRDAAGGSRERTFKTLRKEFDGGSRILIKLDGPADMRGTGLLLWDYDDGKRSDDQWLYLPGVGKVTRIDSGNRSTRFLGSDLTYADLTRQDPDDYEFRMVSVNEEVDGEACWILEAMPRTEKARTETGYLKIRSWVSKQKLMPIRSKAWVKKGKRIKYTQLSDVRRVAGVWTPHRTVIRTVKGKQVLSSTVLELVDVELNRDDVTDAQFQTRALEEGL